MVGRLACADLFADLGEALGAVHHCQLQLDALEGDGEFLEAFKSTGLLEVPGVGLLLHHSLVGEAQSRFHDAAGHAEDGRAAGGLAHEIVPAAVGKAVEVDASLADHVGQLARVQGGVDVAHVAPAEFGAKALVLFRHAGHDGDGVDLFGIVAALLGAVVLCDAAVHADGGLACGEVGEQVGIEGFGILLPAGTAGGELGQIPVGKQAFDEFGRLLPDRDVGRKFRVPAVGEVQLLESRQHLACSHAAGFHAEGFAQSVAHGRRGHGDALDVLVSQLFLKFRHPGLGFVDGELRAVRQALAAVDAGLRMHNFVLQAGFALNGPRGAVLLTGVAADALVGIDLDKEKLVAIRPSGRDVHFVVDMLHCFARHIASSRCIE